MNNEICFKIDSRELFLEQVLVEYNKIPVYFVCKDNNEMYYVALCVDIDDEKYIVVETEIERLVNLFRKKITMRDIILAEEMYWEIIAGDDLSDDMSTQFNIEQINKENLPYSNSYFMILSTEHQEYFELLKNITISNDTDWKKIEFSYNAIICELDIQSGYAGTIINEYKEIRDFKINASWLSQSDRFDLFKDVLLDKNMQIYETLEYEVQSEKISLQNNTPMAA